MPPVNRAICERCRAEVTSKALFCPMCGQPRTTQAADPLIGTVIAERYLLLEKIGQGGSGTIYRADHVALHRKVAVKILHHELSIDDLAVERFRREATTVSEIDNEHIVEVLDFGRTAEGRPFLAMELLDGETLQTAITRQKQLSIDDTIDVLQQVGEALIEAHAMGYIHRDLRPGNIFFARRRGKRFVKILDFGLAKLVEREGEAATTTLGMTFGDPCYMSPEQARGEPVDRRADIYALGIMAYEMLTGRPPFVGKKVFDVLTRHIEAEPPSPSALRADVPPWLDAIVVRALGKRPNDRFVTVYRLIEAIREGRASGAVMSDEAAKSMPIAEPPPPAPRPPRLDDDVISSAPVTHPSPSRRVAMPSLSQGSQSWYDEGDDLTDPVVHRSMDSLEVAAVPPRNRRFLVVSFGIAIVGAALVVGFVWLQGRSSDTVADTAPAPPAAATPPLTTGTPPASTDPAATPPPGPAPTVPGDSAAAPPTAAAPPVPTPAVPPPAPAPAAATATPTPARPATAPAPEPAKPVRHPPRTTTAAARPAKTHPANASGDNPADKATAKSDTPPAGAPPVIDFRKAVAAESKSGEPAAAEPTATTPAAAAAPTPAPAAQASAPSAPAALRPPPPDRDPAQAEFYVKLGQRALRDGDYEGAQENFNKARSFDNTNADAIAGLGAVALKQGNVQDATVHLDAAARLAPSSARIQVLRGQAYLAAGKRDEAAAAFRRALELAPDDAAAARGLNEATGN